MNQKKRQYNRLNLPAQIESNGQRFDVRDISPGGLGINHPGNFFSTGKQYEFLLFFPFEDFTINLKLTAEIIHVKENEQIAGCCFDGLSPEQIDILNYIIASFMAGDLINADAIKTRQGAEGFVTIDTRKEEDIIEKVKNFFLSFNQKS